MQRWKITIEYDGRAFSGWQKQPHHISVQQTIETALFKLSGETASVKVAGRTDAGVHGRGQVAHFDLLKEMTPDTIRMAINALVRPFPIVVVLAEKVSSDFHARFQAFRRSYMYRIINRRNPLTFDKGLAWQVPMPLHVENMHQAAQHLLGKHDFSAFRAAGCQAKHPIRTIEKVTVERRYDDEIVVHVTAPSFLYHQVRNIVGTLVKVGLGEWEPEMVRTILESRDRTIAGITAPPDGLYFMRVEYPAAE